MKPSINREELRILRNKIIDKYVSINIELDSLYPDLNTNKTDIIDICQIIKDVGFIIVDKDSDRELELLEKTVSVSKLNNHK